MILVCKERFIKRQGYLPFLLEETKTQDICFICGKKKRMLKMLGDNDKEMQIIQGYGILK